MSWPTGYEMKADQSDWHTARRGSSGVAPSRDPPGKLRAAHEERGVPSRASVEAANFAALDFLERSRDVANEVVVVGVRVETAPSPREKDKDSGPEWDI
jgi:hypothetical protein